MSNSAQYRAIIGLVAKSKLAVDFCGSGLAAGECGLTPAYSEFIELCPIFGNFGITGLLSLGPYQEPLRAGRG
jgi:hypothetical protein